MSNEKKPSKKRELGAFWAKENQHGVFYSGKINGENVIFVPNNKREGFNEATGKDYNDPDFRAYAFTDEE